MFYTKSFQTELTQMKKKKKSGMLVLLSSREQTELQTDYNPDQQKYVFPQNRFGSEFLISLKMQDAYQNLAEWVAYTYKDISGYTTMTVLENLIQSSTCGITEKLRGSWHGLTLQLQWKRKVPVYPLVSSCDIDKKAVYSLYVLAGNVILA